MNTAFSSASQRHRWFRTMGLFISLFVVMLLSGCPAKTTVSGMVVDSKGKPVVDARVVLGHTVKLQTVGKTDTKGKFNLHLREWCFPICGGGNPSLTVTKQGHTPTSTHTAWNKKTSHTIRLKPVK